MKALINKRLAKEESGFTLIELLVVVIIIGILLAIAIPSYLTFKDRANKAAAQANVRSAVPAVEAYAADNATGDYANIDLPALKVIDGGVKNVTVVPTLLGKSYCLQNDDKTGYSFKKDGPSADIVTGTC